MEMTITLKDAGLILLFIALVVLIVYVIVMIRNLTNTLKQTNKVLEDVKTITDVAQKRTTEVDDVMDDVIGAISGISKPLKGNESTVQSLSSIAKALTSLINVFKGRKD